MQVSGINRQIRNLPILCTAVLHIFIALADSILMRAAERSEGQLAGIRLTLRHAHFRAFLINLFDIEDMRKVQLRVNVLRKHIQRHRHDIQIAGTLTVAEQRAFNAVCTSQQRQLSAGNARAAVIMRMHADNRCLAVFNMTAEIFNLVSISIRRTHLYGRGQIEDNRVFLRRAHFLHDRFADSYREINLCTGKAFRRIFVADIHAAACDLLLRQLTDKLCALHGNFRNALHILAENNLTLQGRGGIVEVNNNILRTAYSLKGFANQLLASLHQHLHSYVIRNMTALDKRAQNFVLRFGGRWKAHFDFLEAQSAYGKI